jgi:hypothetical protein
VQLKAILKEKGGKVTKGVLFLHDIAPAHRTLAAQKKLPYPGFQCLDHPPYSPCLAPSAPPVPWTEKTRIFLSGLQKSEQRAKKCIELRGEYVE